MRFTIPQFIEHEPKIVGPLTFKQFIFLGGAGAICFVLYFLIPRPLFILASTVIGGISLAFAFIKINNMSFVTFVGSFLRYSLSPKMYLWKKGKGKIEVYEPQTAVIKEEILESGPSLKIDGKSRLNNIKTQIETKSNLPQP